MAFRKPSQAARSVEQFHTAFNIAQDIEWSNETLALRLKLLEEEFDEYVGATHELILDERRQGAKVDLLDALADMLYIIYGTADVLHLPLDEAFRRVHESNMSKLDEHGKPIINGENGIMDNTRPVGKVLKSKRYRPPELSDLV